METRAQAGQAPCLPLRARSNSFEGPNEVEPGTLFGPVDDEYEVGDLLGQGTFAKVFKCRQINTNKELAVKVVSLQRLAFLPDFADQEHMLQREVQILRQVRHERIVNLHHFFSAEHFWFLIMELVGGGELFHNIPANRGLSEPEAQYIFIQLLEGIGYIHSQGIIHRDLKPENILIVRTRPLPPPATGLLRDVKIADFGLGKVTDGSLSPAKSCVGSPVYVAPEVIQVGKHGGSYDQACDLWSLGAVLYVILCGQYPFDGKSAAKEITLGTVDELQGNVSGIVNMVKLSLRDGTIRTYGSGGTVVRGPWVLEEDERIFAATQEVGKSALGQSIVFYTTNGRALPIDSLSAKPVIRFVAGKGLQISGLKFEGFRLTGILTGPMARTKGGLLSGIRGWAGDTVDGLELKLRVMNEYESTSTYGGHAGGQVGPWELDPTEFVLAVTQELDKEGNCFSLVFLTTNRFIVLEGSRKLGGERVRLHVGIKSQIDRLRFEGTKLIEAVITDPLLEERSANFRMGNSAWRRCSPHAKQVVKGLLQVDPSKRLCLAGCARCPWLLTTNGAEGEEFEFGDFIKRGSDPEIIAVAAKDAATAHDEAEDIAAIAADPASPCRLGAVSQILGRACSAVDQVELRRRAAPVQKFGKDSGGTAVGPWDLRATEQIFAVLQEMRDPPNCYLGNSIVFFTSTGGVVSLNGSNARPANHYAAPRGQQIRSLSFDGPRLSGIAIHPAGTPSLPSGLIAEIHFRTGAAVDRVEFHLRDRSVVTHGGLGGTGRDPIYLEVNEMILAVAQEYRGEYLGNALYFFTSMGNVIAVKGFEARRCSGFSAPHESQISGLLFEAGSGRLRQIETEPAQPWAVPF